MPAQCCVRITSRCFHHRGTSSYEERVKGMDVLGKAARANLSSLCLGEICLRDNRGLTGMCHHIAENWRGIFRSTCADELVSAQSRWALMACHARGSKSHRAVKCDKVLCQCCKGVHAMLNLLGPQAAAVLQVGFEPALADPQVCGWIAHTGMNAACVAVYCAAHILPRQTHTPPHDDRTH